MEKPDVHLSFIYIGKHLGIADMDSRKSMVEFSGLSYHFLKNGQRILHDRETAYSKWEKCNSELYVVF